MATQLEHGALIQALQRLYNRMALFAYHYRSGLGKHRAVRRHDGDIVSPLHDYIDRISNSAKSGIELEKIETAENHAVGPEARASRADEDTAVARDRQKTRALARYFIGNNVATMLVPEIGKKLKNRTWEHLHEAIRFGRAGDIKNAKLHADLANGTLKEAVQYMSRQEFEEFLGEIF